MAIVPKRKTSKQRKHKRRLHDVLTIPNLVKCIKCSNFIQQHRVCRHCGNYKNRKIEGYIALNDR